MEKNERHPIARGNAYKLASRFCSAHLFDVADDFGQPLLEFALLIEQ